MLVWNVLCYLNNGVWCFEVHADPEDILWNETVLLHNSTYGVTAVAVVINEYQHFNYILKVSLSAHFKGNKQKL